ncbi:MAG: tetratricopeptide repeat protein [candidate division WOR-3 bacterium]|jgi:tetratricopeptide (TPR) repeat protein
MLCGLVMRSQADVHGLVRQGNGFYSRQKFEQALSFYQRAEALEPDNLGIHYNLGNTYYRLGRYADAVSELSLATVNRNPKARAQAFYNLGNTFYRLNQLDQAINAYKMALLANPRDWQAKENLEFCLKKKQEQQSKSDSSQQTQSNQQQQPQPSMGNREQNRPKPQSGGMDREQAERVLQAVQNREKMTQEQVRRARSRRQVEKDW